MTSPTGLIERMKGVEREHRVASAAHATLLDRARDDPRYLADRDLRDRDVTLWHDRLEATYLVRLFALFEAGLRDLWARALGRRSRPGTEVLIARVGAACNVPARDIPGADEVRRYRNDLVHQDGQGGAAPVGLERSRGALCRFFSRMPLHW